MRSRSVFLCLTALSLIATPALAQKPKKKPAAEQPAETDNPYAGSDPIPAPSAAPPSATEAEPPAEPEKKPEAEPRATDGGPADTRSSAMQTYQAALARRKLSAAATLSRQRLRDELEKIEEKLFDGRRDEAIGDLVYIVESPRFKAFETSDEGRALTYLLGDALGRAGAYQPARGYLGRLLSGSPSDTWYRKGARSLVDFGLESGQPRVFLKDLSQVSSSAPEELKGDIAYLAGRAEELERKPVAALAEYAKVTPRSRFWAQATYLSGVIEVERGQYKKGENLFCKVADPKATPNQALLFGGSDFFRVRDLARLGLGRVAHEQFRFDDSRYYYYLVPRDSEHLPEALYEAATGRYEAKDYDGARELMDELKSLDVNHPYEDEAQILDAYLDLATCRFPSADAKLNAFLKQYEPVRDAARRIAADEAAVKKLVEAVRTGSDPASAGLGGDARVARTLGALIRLDPGYGLASRRVAQVDHEMSGLRGAMGELDEARRRIASPKDVKPTSEAGLGQTETDKLKRIESQLAEVGRLLRESERSGKAQGQVEALRKEYETLRMRARALNVKAAPEAAAAKGSDLPDVIEADRQRATKLYGEASQLRVKLEREQLALAKDALVRLDRRLSRLLRRARLGRIETVLGEKRALEVEIEALTQGLLPQTIVDSLDAERYLRDDEEYWPFDGEDWEDEYVGGEGLR